MPVDIGRVFSTSWDIIKQRFWLMLGMWALFFALNIAVSGVLASVMGGSVFALAGAASAMGEPSGLLAGGLGLGVVIMSILVNVFSIVIALAQQCAMALLATPLYRVDFGEAFKISFKGGLTFLVFALLMIVVVIVASLGFALVFMVLAFLGEMATVIGALLTVPLALYLAMRLCVLVPVVAVDRVFNPLQAVATTWRITRGRVMGIFLVTLIWIAITVATIGIPIAMIIGPMLAIESGAGDAAMIGVMGIVLIVVLLFFPLYVVYSIVSVAINSSLHAQLSENHTQSLEETFA